MLYYPPSDCSKLLFIDSHSKMLRKYNVNLVLLLLSVTQFFSLHLPNCPLSNKNYIPNNNIATYWKSKCLSVYQITWPMPAPLVRTQQHRKEYTTQPEFLAEIIMVYLCSLAFLAWIVKSTRQDLRPHVLPVSILKEHWILLCWFLSSISGKAHLSFQSFLVLICLIPAF